MLWAESSFQASTDFFSSSHHSRSVNIPVTADARSVPAAGALSSAETTEAKQIVIGRCDAAPLFEKDAACQEPEGHTVASVPERKEMSGITVMRTDIGKAVWRQREESLPCRFDLHLGKRRQEALEVVPER